MGSETYKILTVAKCRLTGYPAVRLLARLSPGLLFIPDREYGETHSSARVPCCSCSLGQRSINLGGVECRNNEWL